ETEKVDTYATKFKKLISRINVNNGFLHSYMIRTFLNGLKGNNTIFVAIAASKNLSEAIVVARRVKTSNYYGLALNYTTLSAKLKDTESN
ncbi:11767_t:CDS:2, partial [Gigaspora margarita]